MNNIENIAGSTRNVYAGLRLAWPVSRMGLAWWRTVFLIYEMNKNKLPRTHSLRKSAKLGVDICRLCKTLPDFCITSTAWGKTL